MSPDWNQVSSPEQHLPLCPAAGILFYKEPYLILLWASQVVLVVENPPANAGDIRDMCSIPGLGRSPGGGHASPLQYSCLGNPMDRGAWRAIVHGDAKSQTRLKPLSTTILYFVPSGPAPVLCATDSSHFSSPGSPAEDRRCPYFFLGGCSLDILGLTSQLLTGWLVSGKAGLHSGRVQRGSLGRKKVRV